jgi:hypothetical protein
MTTPVVIYVNSGSWADHGTPRPEHAFSDGAGERAGSKPVALAAPPERMRGGDPVARPERLPVTATAPARVGAMDPYRIHHEFPDRWSAYIRAHFRCISQVIAAFGVSERTARKWWDGSNGANGGNVAVAVALHPETAPQMLFAA